MFHLHERDRERDRGNRGRRHGHDLDRLHWDFPVESAASTRK